MTIQTWEYFVGMCIIQGLFLAPVLRKYEYFRTISNKGVNFNHFRLFLVYCFLFCILPVAFPIAIYDVIKKKPTFSYTETIKAIQEEKQRSHLKRERFLYKILLKLFYSK